MTPNQLRALELGETKRHNTEMEDINRYQAKTEKYKAKTARGKAIADTVVGAVSNFIPSASFRFSKQLGKSKVSGSNDSTTSRTPVKIQYNNNYYGSHNKKNKGGNY